MKRSKIINTLILGGSLIISIGGISLASLNAATPGNNSGVYKPINESSNDQTKEGGFQSLEEIKAPKFTDNSPGASEFYYLDPNVKSVIRNLDLYGVIKDPFSGNQLDLDGFSNFNSLNANTIDVLGYFSTASGTSSNFYGNLYMKGGSTLDLQSGSKLILAGGTYADVYSTVDFKDGSNLLLAGSAKATFYGDVQVNSIKAIGNPTYILDPDGTSNLKDLTITNKLQVGNTNQFRVDGDNIYFYGALYDTAANNEYYLDPSSNTRLNSIVIKGDSTLDRTNQQINTKGELSLVNKRYVDSSISPLITNISTLTSRLDSITQQQISSSGVNKTSGQSMSTATSNKDICALSRVRFDPDNENVHPDAQCEIVGNKNNWTLRARSASNNLITVSCNWTCFNID